MEIENIITRILMYIYEDATVLDNVLSYRPIKEKCQSQIKSVANVKREGKELVLYSAII